MYLQQRVVVALLIGTDNSSGQIICNISAEDLFKCKPSVTPPNPTPPSKDCCDVISHANLSCFCIFKNSHLLPFLSIDPNLALQLPTLCNISNPPNC
ncbi:hypothetical protein Fmac_005564 [Flemingia macrophylla]|uniref:Bifunctional inhibitor/plant lipid transfer protein/seed storage helical domain-containing protein n=1 Tax=Flemingia macrophylla TaxID=520843 RepID=A0ABD1N891_9FABA